MKAISAVNDESCTILATPTSAPGERSVNISDFLSRLDERPFVPGNPFTFLWRGLLENLPGCAREAGQVDPEQVAISFVVTLPLPKPDPYIAPGYAITGKLAYLETRADERQDYSTTTPFGPLRVVVTRSAYDVDWGDGSGADKGPFPFAGEPWPHGRITHTYTHAGRYDVRVTEHWQAQWTLGQASGTITGLRSAPATIPGFEARQVQAVRNR
ncbi:MAG TPA: PKD domain-containing protein [Acidimicrobiales bacterium]|nr:PKD domain-containing protein [Acidimicrobiales bacterium]